MASLFEHQGGGAAHEAAGAGGQHHHRPCLRSAGGRARLLRRRHVQRHVRVLRGEYKVSHGNLPWTKPLRMIDVKVVSSDPASAVPAAAGN